MRWRREWTITVSTSAFFPRCLKLVSGLCFLIAHYVHGCRVAPDLLNIADCSTLTLCFLHYLYTVSTWTCSCNINIYLLNAKDYLFSWRCQGEAKICKGSDTNGWRTAWRRASEVGENNLCALSHEFLFNEMLIVKKQTKWSCWRWHARYRWSLHRWR